MRFSRFESLVGELFGGRWRAPLRPDEVDRENRVCGWARFLRRLDLDRSAVYERDAVGRAGARDA